jgi:hypothetical protein
VPVYTEQMRFTMSAEEKRALAKAAAERGVTQTALLRAGLVLVTGRRPKSANSEQSSTVAAGA